MQLNAEEKGNNFYFSENNPEGVDPKETKRKKHFMEYRENDRNFGGVSEKIVDID